MKIIMSEQEIKDNSKAYVQCYETELKNAYDQSEYDNILKNIGGTTLSMYHDQLGIYNSTKAVKCVTNEKDKTLEMTIDPEFTLDYLRLIGKLVKMYHSPIVKFVTSVYKGFQRVFKKEIAAITIEFEAFADKWLNADDMLNAIDKTNKEEK